MWKQYIDETEALVREHRPELVGDFPKGHELLSNLGVFLTKNFPGPQWGSTHISEVPGMLRSMLGK